MIKYLLLCQFLLTQWICTLQLSMTGLGTVLEKCVGHFGIKKGPEVFSGTTVKAKIFDININWCSYPRRVPPLTGSWIHKNLIFISMWKECMSRCFSFSSQKQRISGETVVMTYFLMFNSNLQIRWKMIISKPSLRYKESISLPSITAITESKPFNMKTWISR